MSRLPLRLLALLLACPAFGVSVRPLTVGTFNLRMPYDKGKHAWEARLPRCRTLLAQRRPVLLGVQEAHKHQLLSLIADTSYAYIGGGRDDFRDRGEHSAIIYDRARLELLEQGTFGLSEHPETPGIRSWNSGCPRIATWGLFRDRLTQRRLLFYNTHLDHISDQARVQGLQVILRHLQAKNQTSQLPVILTGDFNATPSSKVYGSVTAELDDTAAISRTPHQGPAETFNGYRDTNRLTLDYIFVSKGVAVLSHLTDTTRFDDGAHASDHDPVFAVIELP